MGCTPRDTRQRMVKAVRSRIPISQVARVFGVDRNTVKRWVRRAHHPGREGFRDKSRRPHTIRVKVTPSVKAAILLISGLYEQVSLSL